MLMAESTDEEEIKVEEVLRMEVAFYVEPGKTIQDSGCTSPVMGEQTWESWLPILEKKRHIRPRCVRYGQEDLQVRKRGIATGYP